MFSSVPCTLSCNMCSCASAAWKLLQALPLQCRCHVTPDVCNDACVDDHTHTYEHIHGCNRNTNVLTQSGFITSPLVVIR